MSGVIDVISKLSGEQRKIMNVLHQIIVGNIRLEAKIRYKVPFYFHKSWICYLNPLKKGGVELCFLRANELSNEGGLLDFKDRKQVAGLSFFATEDIDEFTLNPILQEALILDETVKYASKRKK